MTKAHNPQASEGRDETDPPAYQPHEGEQQQQQDERSTSNDHTPSSSAANGEDDSRQGGPPVNDGHQDTAQDRTQDGNQDKRRATPKERFALSLQRTCNAAVKSVLQNSMITKNRWAEPLSTAPEAISTMAILFKVADRDEAKGLKIDSREVHELSRQAPRVAPLKDSTEDDCTKAQREQSAQQEAAQKQPAQPKQAQPNPARLVFGTQVVGELPSDYLHTNLEHCSDLGRLAFQDAQLLMKEIHTIATGLIGEFGGIATIIAYLEEPEEAKKYLKVELEAVQQAATKCLRTAQEIAEKFRYWHLVIVHLNYCSMNQENKLSDEKKKRLEKIAEETEETIKFEAEKERLKSLEEDLQTDLISAQREIDRAEHELDELNNLPPLEEPPVMNDMQTIYSLLPQERVILKDRGFWVNTKNWWFGKSDKHMKEDDDRIEAAQIRTQNRRDQALKTINEAREMVHTQRQLILNRLEHAKENEKTAKEKIDRVQLQLAGSKAEFRKADAGLTQTRATLEKLTAEKMELTSIISILGECMRPLSQVKTKIEDLVEFFSEICQLINTNIDKDLNDFLRPISSDINGTVDEAKLLQMGRLAKNSMMFSAMQMQARFSAIADISSTYVQVSTRFIRPAIREIADLSKLKGAEWDAASEAFAKKCEIEMAMILSVTENTSRGAEGNMRKSIGYLQDVLTEAWEDRSGD